MDKCQHERKMIMGETYHCLDCDWSMHIAVMWQRIKALEKQLAIVSRAWNMAFVDHPDIQEWFDKSEKIEKALDAQEDK